MMNRSFGVAFACAASACNVSTPLSTGGAKLDPSGGPCPTGLVVSSSDYTATNISILSPTGSTLSEILVSTASTTTGLSTPLSGDVILPLEAPSSGRVVLLDRFPNSVLTWVDPATASVLGQLKIGTGFASNPQDYLEVSQDKAYVTRYEANGNPGQEPNDGGSDVLVIDAKGFAIEGRLDLSTPADGIFSPHPSHLLRMGTEAWVVLHRYTADFSDAADARVLGLAVADDQIAWSLDLSGVANCGGLARSPSGHVVALSCSGLAHSRSAVVLLDATAHPPRELMRFDVAPALNAPPASPLAFASETLLFGVALGDKQAGKNDLVYTLDTSTAKTEIVFDGGDAFVLGDVRCGSGCTDLCFVADAHAVGLRAWKVEGSALTMQPFALVDPSLGLAPRSLGGL
jgi:hypothetical protein